MKNQGQFEFGFVVEAVSFRKWVRSAVMSFKPFNAGGWGAERNKRVTLNDWLMWHAPLNGIGGGL